MSPDGSKLVWEVTSGKRPALRVRDLDRGTGRVLPVPGPLSGANIITLADWAWRPDSRRLAVRVLHGISVGYSELKTVDVATGRWRHRFNFEPGQRQIECCAGMAWPAGSRRIAVVQTLYSQGAVRVTSIEIGDQVPADVAGGGCNGGAW